MSVCIIVIVVVFRFCTYKNEDQKDNYKSRELDISVIICCDDDGSGCGGDCGGD